MFGESTEHYDVLYRWKDYGAEAAQVRELIGRFKRSPGRRLLDLACGTGMHMEQFRDEYEVEGVDVLEGMVRMSRERNPGAEVHVGDMRTFDLGRRFDVILCLFSSIGYLASVEELAETARRIRAHLEPGGVAIVEAWLTKEQCKAGMVHMLTVDEPELKICRMNTSAIDGDVSVIDFHYLVGTPQGTRHFTESHRLKMFEPDDFRRAFEEAGLEYTVDEGFARPAGAPARGLHIGVAPG